MGATYAPGQAVILDGVPAVILEALPSGTLKVSTFPGIASFIGDCHSKLHPLSGDLSPAFADRLSAIRAYYGAEERGR